ncbi:hypothetical protein EVAR_36232_1 [Eumeta japonica]|uniref:Uncharacterized protein n=1 Tax=Eumeta variegata TaxID=151549 RepID=A0A4C1WZL0_EUMVA|nr:hypothetical protein EVAR_36232_1 [Eumeta japonica]
MKTSTVELAYRKRPTRVKDVRSSKRAESQKEDDYILYSGREIDASQAERLGRLSIARSALSLARSAQAERDNKSCFSVCAAGVHRFIRRYHVKNCVLIVQWVMWFSLDFEFVSALEDNAHVSTGTANAFVFASKTDNRRVGGGLFANATG